MWSVRVRNTEMWGTETFLPRSHCSTQARILNSHTFSFSVLQAFSLFICLPCFDLFLRCSSFQKLIHFRCSVNDLAVTPSQKQPHVTYLSIAHGALQRNTHLHHKNTTAVWLYFNKLFYAIKFSIPCTIRNFVHSSILHTSVFHMLQNFGDYCIL